MKISDAQELIRRMYYERDKARGLFSTFTWFVEEVGELADSLLKMNKQGLEEEFADVFAWLLSLANLVGVDLERVFKNKYVKSGET